MTKTKRVSRIITLALSIAMVFAMAAPTFAAEGDVVSGMANRRIYAYGGSVGAGLLNRYGNGAVQAGQSVSVYPDQNSTDQRWDVLMSNSGERYIAQRGNPSLVLNMYRTGPSGGAQPCTLQPYLPNNRVDTEVRLESNNSRIWLLRNTQGWYYLRADKSAVNAYSDVLWYQSNSALNDTWYFSA